MHAQENPLFSRRQLVRGALAGSAALAAGHVLAQSTTPAAQAPSAGAASGPITLPPLPYPIEALEPVISKRTLEFHHGKHHKGYVDTLNGLIQGTDLAGLSLDEVVRKSRSDASRAKIFNNAAQVHNHTFYWNSLKPGGGGKPAGDLLAKIEAAYKTFDEFRAALIDMAMAQFGSGWVWVILEGQSLKLAKTSNADMPIALAQKPLLTIDVWEHAYYLDYQNLRKDYVTQVVDKLLNWDFAAKNAA